MARANFSILVIAILMISLPLRSQESKQKIKSIVITEDKYDMLIKKQYKESEVYYDQRGNIVEEISYKEGKVNKHFKYQYDDDDNKIREEEFGPSGKLIKVSEYKIENGLRVEKTVYDHDLKIKSRKNYVYTMY